MPTFLGRLAILGLSSLASLLPRGALAAQTAARESAARSPEAAYTPPTVAVALRLFPPLGYWGITNTTSGLPILGLGGLGVGIISKGGLWIEGSVRELQGQTGGGVDGTLLVGYVANRKAPLEAWEFTVPFHAGYRYAARPNTHISDGVVIIEPLHLLVAGTRVVWSRHYSESAFELSLGVLGGPVLWRVDPNHPNYSDGATHFWLEAAVAVGFVFDSIE